MAGRIALGLVAAIRAVLIYGDAAELSDRPLELPRWIRGRPVRDRAGDGRLALGWAAEASAVTPAAARRGVPGT